MEKARTSANNHSCVWITSAALVFGSSVWALHFVAMVAFLPGQQVAYSISLTVLSDIVAVGGSFGALMAWRAPLPRPVSIAVGGALLGLSVSAMHYIGVAAMTFSGFLLFDRTYVLVSLAVSISFSIVALTRASNLNSVSRRLEVGGWLTMAICGLHFTGMTAVTIAPGIQDETHGAILGTTTLAIAIAIVSVAILTASQAAVMVEHHLSQRALKDLGRMRLLADLAQEVLLIQSGGIVREVNKAGERLFDAAADTIIGCHVLTLFADDSAPALLRREQCAPRGRLPEEMKIKTSRGTYVDVELSCQPIEYLGKNATAIALRDLTDRKRDEAHMRHLARHDNLTGLSNRFSLQERLGIALETAAQTRHSLAIVYIDLDRFKFANDLYGHAVGDALLVQASKRIMAEISSADTLARIGGDEFVLIVTSQPQPEKASILATRIVEALRRPFQIEGNAIEIGASIGIALYPEDGSSADALMRAADAGMYRAKEDGRGCVRFFEAAMNAELQARLQLTQELAGALQRDELLLHYQPIVNSVSGQIETFEALIRWMHPTRGMIPPMEFIPLAEASGQIDQIGQWVIDTACREAAQWPRPWCVSINVSPRQFRQTDVCRAIARALTRNALEPSRVVVEVTEGVLIEDAAKAVATLMRLREMGVRVALDDFGTGYSSLSYLQLFKFDKFKIDKSFVKRLGQKDEVLTITRTIINLGHNLGLQVTAEGVESEIQLDLLRSLGCDYIQGYLIGRPAPMSSFTELYHSRTRLLLTRERQRLTA